MLPDLERLIRLQRLETSTEEARRTIADQPQRILDLDRRLEEARALVASAKHRVTESQTIRRNEERELATVQSRLTRYKDQLLEVKTNREYQAMQHEIAAAQAEVSRHEDRILERMLELDELTREVKQAESNLVKVQSEVIAERAALEEQARQLETLLSKAASTRASLVAEISPPLIATFDNVARGRKGVAVAEAREGHCTLCHVRLRPQVFNEIRRNDAIIQCDSCQRILYFAGPSSGGAAGTGASPSETAGAS
jgi:hypothetical protein